MNENINLCKVLRGHEGETFYSPIFGELTLSVINPQTLEFTSIEMDTVVVESSGKFYDKADELCVFPSKDQLDWNKWIEEHNVPKTWSELSNKHISRINGIISVVEYGVDSILTPIEKSAFALLKIHQLIEIGYGGNVKEISYHTAGITPNLEIAIEEEFNEDFKLLYPLIFKNIELAKEFLKYPENVQLLKDYFMI